MGIGRPNLSIDQEVFYVGVEFQSLARNVPIASVQSAKLLAARPKDVTAKEVFKFRLHMDIILKGETEARTIAGLMRSKDRRPLKAALSKILERGENGNFRGGHALLKALSDDVKNDGKKKSG